ncbi:hypothetical protein M9H77_12951 [Catharanthus roseus]|uniref:Uncharacterized protein n=1 Tax=Catharanthus roseus TaxID=4058 RepID=A0ACC0BIX7_CATRO|nr:hypothetical protein M9H77_12951 [Catharanthus roseus]
MEKCEHERSVSPHVVSSAAGKAERIKTHQRIFYAPNLKEHIMQQWVPRTKFGSPKQGHQKQVPVSRSQYQPNIIQALDYKQTHSHITGQNRLQTLGTPTRSALGPTSVSSPSLLSTRRPSHRRA